MAELAPIAISMGEPAGIGPDLILELYERRADLGLPPFLVFGNLAFLAARARRLGLNLNFAQTTIERSAGEFPSALPVMHIDGLVPDKPGDTSPLSGKVVIESIASAVAETLAGEGIAVEVVDPRTLVPLDVETIRASVRKTGRLVIVDEAPATCSAASEIAAMVVDDLATFRALKAPVRRVCAAPVPVPYSPPLEQAALPDRARIAAAVRRVLEESRA